jgi:hypothetical protein
VLKPISLCSDENNILKSFNEEDIKYIKSALKKKEEVVNNLYILNFNYTQFQVFIVNC